MNLVNRLKFFSQENYRMGGSFKWPPLSEVLEYRRQVRELVINIIETAPLELPITQDHPWVCLVRSSIRRDTVLISLTPLLLMVYLFVLSLRLSDVRLFVTTPFSFGLHLHH